MAVALAGAAATGGDSSEEEPIDLQELVIARKLLQRENPISRRVTRYMQAVQKATEEDRAAEGLALLDRLDLDRLNPVERAYVYRLRAYVEFSEGNYEATIEGFQNVLEEEAMSPEDDNRIRFNIAQIHAALQHWPEVVEWVGKWRRYAPAPEAKAHHLLGISYYQLGQQEDAIRETESALELSPERPEGWLQLLAALHVQKEDYRSAAPVLEELITRFPKKQYWVQLSLIYGALDRYMHSLAVQQVAYVQGLLTDDKELRRLARSYLYHELPYPAAQVLEEGLAEGRIEEDPEAYELLANSWIAAREYDKALGPLQKAASIADSGKLFVRLGQVYLQRENWAQAIENLSKGIEKGDLDDLGNAQLLLGIAYYNDQRVAQARSSFQRARQHESTKAKADNWIEHIDNEANTG